MYIITNLPLGPLKQAMNVYTFDSAFYYPGVLNLRRPIEDSFLCTRKKVIKIYLINKISPRHIFLQTEATLSTTII